MKWKKKAWDWCSKYIRLRDAAAYCKKMGILYELHVDELVVPCCTCHAIHPWRYIKDESAGMDAGHYFSKGIGGGSGAYFDERNIHAQCKRCNGFKQGSTQVYTDFMLAKYGQKTIDLLRIKHHTPQRWTETDYQLLHDMYKEMYENLRKKIEAREY